MKNSQQINRMIKSLLPPLAASFFTLIVNAQKVNNTNTKPDSSIVKKELIKNYEKIVAGFRNNDPGVWLGYLTEDFHLKLFNGALMDKKWVINYVTANAKNFKITQLAMTIEQVESSGVDDTLFVRQISERTFLDSQKNVHTLAVGAIQKEVWTPIDHSWRLKFVQEYQVLYVKKDGQ